jgi:hypothetical protein
MFAMGATAFRTKEEATKYFRGLLWASEIGAPKDRQLILRSE